MICSNCGKCKICEENGDCKECNIQNKKTGDWVNGLREKGEW